MCHTGPVDPGRLHRDVGAALGGEPFRQCQQFLGGCLEGAHLALRAVDHVSHAGHDRLLVYVEAGAMRIQNFHRPSCRSAPPGVGRRHKDSKDRAPERLPALGALFWPFPADGDGSMLTQGRPAVVGLT
jgi:hypothetical protein